MSGDPQLAAASARIAELTEELTAVQATIGRLSAAQSSIAADRDTQARLAAAAEKTLADEREQHRRDLVSAAAALAEANAATARARSDYAALSDRLSAEHQARIDQAEARLAEIEALCLADPPEGGGIVHVQRYMTSDGRKHKTLPDAEAAARQLGPRAKLKEAGLGPREIEAVLSIGPALARMLRE